MNRVDRTLDLRNQTEYRWRPAFQRASWRIAHPGTSRPAAHGSGRSGRIQCRYRFLVERHRFQPYRRAHRRRALAFPAIDTHTVEQVIRLDALPHVARAASKRSLQNPDFVLLGRRDGELTLQAADAKFSIETARSKQVSVEMLDGTGRGRPGIYQFAWRVARARNRRSRALLRPAERDDGVRAFGRPRDYPRNRETSGSDSA